MEFSKNYLLKYGWKEGEGLGKTQSGIKQAIKPRLKFDKQGMGYNPSCEFTDNWWKTIYNEALENIQLITNKESSEYSNKVENHHQTKKKKRKSESVNVDNLFEACEGRTAHKGARHGLTLSGKLQRLQEQDQAILNKDEDKNKSNEESDNSLNLCLKSKSKRSKIFLPVIKRESKKKRTKSVL